MSNVINADTKAVRSFFNENPNLIPTGDKTVGPDCSGKGRVSAQVKTIFAAHNPNSVFVEGEANKVVSTISLTYKHEQKSGRKVNKVVNLSSMEVRALAGAGARGRLSAQHLAQAGEAYAKSLKTEVTESK